MAKNITELTELTAVATGDLFIVEDVSASTTKKITWDNLVEDASIGPNKLATGASSAIVTTSQTTTSTTYTNLTTTGPAVTVTVGANGLALVAIYTQTSNNTANARCLMSIDVSGANTIAAADDKAIEYQSYATNSQHRFGATFLYSGLTPGSTTFTAKYKIVSASTGTFANRTICAIPL